MSKAEAYGQKGDYRHAVQDATRSIKLEPSAEAYYTRALAYHNMGQDEVAIRDCNAALAVAPDNENALFVRASAHQGKMDYSEAIQDFTDVLRLDPDRADAFFARGVAYYSAADFERAADDFSRAIKLTRLCLRPTRCIGWRGWCKWTPVEPAGTCPGYKSSKLGGSEDPWTTGARDEHSAIGGGSLA